MIVCIILFSAITAFISTLVKECKKRFKGRKTAVMTNQAVGISGSQSPLIQEITAPPWVIDEIMALEHSADVLRRKKDWHDKQAAITIDPEEQLKQESKSADLGEKIARKYAKINKLKDKYCMEV